MDSCSPFATHLSGFYMRKRVYFTKRPRHSLSPGCGLAPGRAVPSQGTLHPLTGIFSPPECPHASSRAAGVLTRRDEDGRAC